MASLPRPEAQDPYTSMRDLKWSPAEKAIARKAFERALQQDLEAVIREAKKMAEKVAQPSDLWELEHYLTQRRKEIDRQYDYRYSVLTVVFASLIRKGRLREEDLQGLAEEKLGHIRQMAQALKSQRLRGQATPHFLPNHTGRKEQDCAPEQHARTRRKQE
jgi:hypothetical protein